MVNVRFTPCPIESFNGLVARLDDEFVVSKGKTTSLKTRFPKVFSDNKNFVVAVSKSEILSNLAIQRFELLLQNELLTGAMVGLVWTDSHHREQGLARSLIKYALQVLKSEGIDFAILWTARPELYRGSGWILADQGSYATAQGHGISGANPTPHAPEWTVIQNIRDRRADPHVHIPGTYQPNLPPFADSHLLIQCEDAYAILGMAGDNAYLLDIVATIEAIRSLWKKVLGSARRIHINLPCQSPLVQWLASNHGVQFTLKPLTMWHPLSARSEPLDLSKVYIPFSERI